MIEPAPLRQLKPKPKQEPVDGRATDGLRARSSTKRRSPAVGAPSFRLVGFSVLEPGARAKWVSWRGTLKRHIFVV